jgi:hypothetical protein
MQIKKKIKPNRDTQKPENVQLLMGTLASGALTIDPFEMALVVSIAGEIAQKKPPEVFQQILSELRKMYQDERPEKFVSVCWRLFSLYKLIQSGALAQWVPDDVLQKNEPLPPGVVFVAATLPLKNSQGFNPDEFTTALAECDACEM